MAGRPQQSLHTQSLSTRSRTASSPHPAPNNAGLVLVVMMVLAILVAATLVGPGLVAELRQVVYCVGRSQEAACQIAV